MATTTTSTIATDAALADQVITEVLKVMPFVSTVIQFVPGAAVATPFVPLFVEFLGVLDNAAKAVAAGNTQAAIGAILGEIMSHLTPGMPNAPALAPTAAPVAKPDPVPDMPPPPAGT